MVFSSIVAIIGFIYIFLLQLSVLFVVVTKSLSLSIVDARIYKIYFFSQLWMQNFEEQALFGVLNLWFVISTLWSKLTKNLCLYHFNSKIPCSVYTIHCRPMYSFTIYRHYAQIRGFATDTTARLSFTWHIRDLVVTRGQCVNSTWVLATVFIAFVVTNIHVRAGTRAQGVCDTRKWCWPLLYSSNM